MDTVSLSQWKQGNLTWHHCRMPQTESIVSLWLALCRHTVSLNFKAAGEHHRRARPLHPRLTSVQKGISSTHTLQYSNEDRDLKTFGQLDDLNVDDTMSFSDIRELVRMQECQAAPKYTNSKRWPQRDCMQTPLPLSICQQVLWTTTLIITYR